MPYPRIRDNGQTVELDLHGARVDEAIAMTRKLLAEAVRRGRSSVSLIHGYSTSDSNLSNRTIKRALYELLEEPAIQEQVSSVIRYDGALHLSLPIGTRSHGARLTLLDLQ